MTRSALFGLLFLASNLWAHFPPIDGTDPSGRTDSTAAIQAALNVTGEVDLPAGTFLVSSTLFLNNSGSFKGEGVGATRIVCSNPASTVLAVRTSGVRISDLEIEYLSLATGGAGILGDGNLFDVDHVTISGFFFGVSSPGYVRVGEGVSLFSNAPGAIGIFINGQETTAAWINGCFITVNGPKSNGIEITGVGSCQISNVLCVSAGTGISLIANSIITQVSVSGTQIQANNPVIIFASFAEIVDTIFNGDWFSLNSPFPSPDGTVNILACGTQEIFSTLIYGCSGGDSFYSLNPNTIGTVIK